MRLDKDAIGGFFEDLPVLAIILTGSFLIIGTNAFVAEQRDSADSLHALDEAAESFADAMLAALSDEGRSMVSLDRLRLFEPASVAPDCLESSAWAVTLAVLHPWQERIVTVMRGVHDALPDSGWQSRLFNVRYGASGIAVAELIVVVFSNPQ